MATINTTANRFFSVGVLTLALGSLAIFPFAEAKSTSTTYSPAASMPTQLDAQLSELQQAASATRWQWEPDHADAIKLDDLILRASTHHPLVVEAESRLAETRAKEDEVDSKRILFIFKYFDARYMEGSAELDVQSAESALEAARQQALKQTFNQYAAWLKATAASAVAHGQWQVAAAEHLFAQRQFEQGSLNGLQLAEAHAALLSASQQATEANSQRRQACIPLQALLDIDDVDETCTLKHAVWLKTVAEEPELSEADVKLAQESMAGWLPRQTPLHNWLLPLAEKPTKLALHTRPDLQALRYRQAAVKKLMDASWLPLTNIESKVLEATYEGIKARVKLLENQILAEVEAAQQALLAAKAAQQLAEVQRQVAARGWHQARVSVAAGMLSEREALAIEQAYLQAQAGQLAADLNVLTAKTGLLYAAGQLQAQPLLAAMD